MSDNIQNKRKLTPMMRQYLAIKENYKDCILMFRLGDFYEMFFDDAVVASQILQITLTARNKKGAGEPIKMCGIPYHALDSYLSKLTQAGKKVALCDQVTEPTGKGIVEREVIRVVTPGTTFDTNILDNKANNFTACFKVNEEGSYTFAYADLTTGDFRATNLENSQELISELKRVSPVECICKSEELHTVEKLKDIHIYTIESEKDVAEKILYDYLKETQKTDLEHFRGIRRYSRNEFMPLDENTIRNLELFYNNHDGSKQGSLISILDETMTSMGGRMLRKWLMYPLIDSENICERLDNVEIFVKDSNLLRNIRSELSSLYDIERLLSKLSLGTGNARDLLAMKNSLKLIPEIKALLIGNLSKITDNLEILTDLVNLIENSIVEDPPIIINNGGMIKMGFDEELDELLKLGSEGKNFIAQLQKREKERTGISSLKVKFNKVFGYYIEISNANKDLVPEDYIRKQTLVNAERFITPELKEYEEKVLNAEEKSKKLEYEIFYKVRMEVVKKMMKIQKNAASLAEIDVLSSFAFSANKYDYTKAKIKNNGNISIKNARHPVVERMVPDFIANDCDFDDKKSFKLITGPNMGGKSTYLRQTALIILLAQIGSYVPATDAQISVVDQIFTRVGASDNLAKGESTFMVEMNEAAHILENATSKSLVILDELGRGTSTYDGLSIAWAVSEFLHNKLQSKTLFATHYHELISLSLKLEKAENISVAVRENEKEGVVFLYKIVEGGVDQSYGIEVAKLAGLPKEVTDRANEILQGLEKNSNTGVNNTSNTIPTNNSNKKSETNQIIKTSQRLNNSEYIALKKLKEIDINTMTPLEIVNKINEIKKDLNKKY